MSRGGHSTPVHSEPEAAMAAGTLLLLLQGFVLETTDDVGARPVWPGDNTDERLLQDIMVTSGVQARRLDSMRVEQLCKTEGPTRLRC